MKSNYITCKSFRHITLASRIKRKLRISIIILCIGMIVPLFGFDDMDFRKEQVRQSEDIRQLQEKIGQFQNDVKSMQIENEHLKSEILRIKTDLITSQEAHAQHRKEIDRLDDLIKKLDAARQQDRKVIIEEVSREISLIKNTSSQPPPTKNKGGKSSATVVEEGVEHLVEKGESLFAIAEAYGVTVKSVKEANQLKSNELRVGQKLFIPKKSKNKA